MTGDDDAPQAWQPVPFPHPAGVLERDVGDGPGPAATAPAGGRQPSVVSTVATRPTLRYGSRGPHVVYLQQRLSALRYDVGPIDGIFGSSTLHGVYAFQKVQGIGVDGVVGPITWSRLASPSVPRARYSRSAAAVEVNLTRRVVYLTRSGAVTRILDASPGKPATPTPTGSFSIYRRIDGWRQSPLGLLWRPNYFYRGYALHGSTSVPTSAASHGCVRVTVPAMNRVWSQLFIGERVYVYR
ncbi:MAG TPA: L,D-transpeptidase family protein [Actinomycetes bacterium]|nr:L,D-transpeptidase family protein [Actinomycetes bacterium]